MHRMNFKVWKLVKPKFTDCILQTLQNTFCPGKIPSTHLEVKEFNVVYLYFEFIQVYLQTSTRIQFLVNRPAYIKVHSAHKFKCLTIIIETEYCIDLNSENTHIHHSNFVSIGNNTKYTKYNCS